MDSKLWQITVYEIIKNEHEVSVSSLSERFQVSPMTIRRVLMKLEEFGLIERSYGKARIIDNSKAKMPFSIRKTSNLSEKEKIAQVAVELILAQNIRSIYLDGSSTAVVLANAIPRNLALTVFTNNVPVLNVLLGKPWLKTYVIGGFLDYDAQSLSDISAGELYKQVFVDASFSSCSGFTNMGVFDNDFPGTQIRRIFSKNSAANYLLADHTKFNVHSIFLHSTWDAVDALITDQRPPEDLVQCLTEHNVRIHFPQK